MVKYLAVILSMFFLALNFVPCADGDSFISMENELATEEHQDSSGHTDLCSPFCHCHCCHFHFIDFALDYSPYVTNPEISTAVFAHIDNLGEEIPHPLLQPPRV